MDIDVPEQEQLGTYRGYTYHPYVFVCNSMLLLESWDRIKESLPALREWVCEKKNDGVGFSFTKRTFLADYL